MSSRRRCLTAKSPCGEELALAGEAGEDGLAFAMRREGGNQPASVLEGAVKCWIWVWYLV